MQRVERRAPAPARLARLAELGQHRDAARGDVGGRRIEQRAVVGERDVVEVIVGVVGVEGAPSRRRGSAGPRSIRFARAIAVAFGPGAAPRLPDPSPSPRRRCRRGRGNGRWRTGTPSRQGARPGRCAAQSPLTSRTCRGFSHARPALARSLPPSRRRPRAARAPQAPCPRPATRRAGNRPRRRRRPAAARSTARAATTSRMVGRIAERVEHQHAVGHGREDRAEAVVAVEPLDRRRRPRRRSRACAVAGGKRARRACRTASTASKNLDPAPGLMGALRPSAHRLGRRDEQLVDARRRAGSWRSASAPAGRAAARARCAPSRRSCSRWNGNQRGRSMISTGIAGVPRQGIAPYSASRKRVKTLRRVAAAMREDRLARPAHVRRLRVVADHLQREIGLHAGADVERAGVKQRPAAVRRPGCGADRRRSCARAPRPAARRGNAGTARIPPGWSRRPRARSTSARRPAGARASASLAARDASLDRLERERAVKRHAHGEPLRSVRRRPCRAPARTIDAAAVSRTHRPFDRSRAVRSASSRRRGRRCSSACARAAAWRPAIGVAAKVARFSLTICQGGRSGPRPPSAATSRQIAAARSSRGCVEQAVRRR